MNLRIKPLDVLLALLITAFIIGWVYICIL